MPIRAASVGRRKRLRLISLVAPSSSVSTNVHTQFPSWERQLSTCSGSTRSIRIWSSRSRSCHRSRGAESPGARGRHYACRGQEGSRSSRRCRRHRVGRAHLRQPRPHVGGGSLDLDRARRHAVGGVEQLVAGQPGCRLRLRRTPGQNRPAKERLVERANGAGERKMNQARPDELCSAASRSHIKHP